MSEKVELLDISVEPLDNDPSYTHMLRATGPCGREFFVMTRLAPALVADEPALQMLVRCELEAAYIDLTTNVEPADV